MADLKKKELMIEILGSDYLASQKDSSEWHAIRNKLAKELWDYAKELRKIKYSDVPEYVFEESISDTVIRCLQVTPRFWVKEFKTALKRNVFKNKADDSKNGVTGVSDDVIKLGRNLKKWLEYKNIWNTLIDDNKWDSVIDEKLYECGRLWGKTDAQIKKALDWLANKCFIAGNAHAGDDDSDNEVFDFLSEESVFGVDDSFEIRKQKLLLYVTAANDEYVSRRKKESANSQNIVFYSKYFTNLIVAALLKGNLPDVNIAKTLEVYEIIDRVVLEDFQEKLDWSPNTNRKDIGLNCGIKEDNIGKVYDRFKEDVNARYEKFLETEGLA